jgi:hypothetical protein
VRRAGGGRKRTLQKDPTLLADLEGLVEPSASGDPESPLRWTAKSVRQLAGALQGMGHAVSRQLVAELLAEAGYSLQANRKTREGAKHPDRDAQFRYISRQVRRFPSHGPAGHLRRHEEEGTGGGLQGAGRPVAPEGTARAGPGA